MEQCNKTGHTLRNHQNEVVEKASKENDYYIHGKKVLLVLKYNNLRQKLNCMFCHCICSCLYNFSCKMK